MGNLFEDVQKYVADKLNADSQLSGLCSFIPEERKDIDFEIKNALGRQGIVGLILVPRATFAGNFEGKSLAWQIDELEIDVVENVTVNRGKRDGYITGQAASMRLFDVLCPLNGDNVGQFLPVSYEEGEDGNLLVNKCVLKCLVHNTPDKSKTIVQYSDGTVREIDIKGQMTRKSIPDIGNIVKVEIGDSVMEMDNEIFSNCTNLRSVTIPGSVNTISNLAFWQCTNLTNVVINEGVKSIGVDSFFKCTGLTSFIIPSSVTSISKWSFSGCSGLAEVTFVGKTIEEVQSMPNYPWGLPTEIIHAGL